MQFQIPEFAIAYAVSAVLCIISAGMLWKRRINPGSAPFALLMLSLAAWSIATIFETGATTVTGKIFWSKWQYLGITTVAPLWLIFTAYYTGREKTLSKTAHWLIWIIPSATLLLAFTNELHHLIWTDVTVVQERFFIGHYGHGIAFYVHMAFSYACLLIGTIWMVMDTLSSPKGRRFQSIIFIVSIIIGWSANFLYILGLIPITGFDVTPLSFSLISLVIFWTISRFQLFDLVPIARDALLSSMSEGVIVIDPNDMILEINPAALEITGYEGMNPVGRSIWEVFRQYESEINQFKEKTNIKTEVELPGDDRKTIDIQITSIDKEGENKTGQLIILRDITKQKETERVEKDQRKFAETLADTAAVINSSLDQNEVLERILQNVAKVVPHDAANVALVTEQGKAEFVRVKNSERYSPMDSLVTTNLNVLEMTNFKKMAETKKPLIVLDTQTDENWTKNLEQSIWIRSYLGAPIIHQGQLLGFLNLDSGDPDFFKPEDARRLAIFANYAATALTNAKLYSNTRFYADEMAILYEISLAIAAGVGLEKTTQAVFRQLKRVIPTDLFFLALYEPKKKIVSYFMYRENEERIDIEPFYLLQRPSLTRYVMEKQETVYIPDFKAEDAEVKEEDVIKVPGFDNRSFLGIPLILRGEVIGVLSVQSSQPEMYDTHQIRLVETIAQQATIAMDNAKLFERMQEMAITDSLTEIFNRRYFYVVLRNEIERAKRYDLPLSLVMIDIDHFKPVNDKLGHLSGDEVLQILASICKKLLRHSDNMFRYGGEEFMILLPETSFDEAANVAERIRMTIEETDFRTRKGKVNITVSIGVSGYSADFQAPNAFIESVDKTLYLAKQSGRNCVRVFTDL